MYKVLFFLLFSTIVFAKNPFPFSALGDIIYDNAPKIEKLKKIDDFAVYNKKIDNYILDVKKAKQEGFSLEKKSNAILRKSYLEKLRSLAKTNDYFVHLVKVLYKNSIKTDNPELFSKLVNSGLLDTDAYKKEIINYYFAHQKSIDSHGVIQKYLDEDAKLKAKKEAQQRRYNNKKAKEAERIRYIREQDKIQQERLEKKLQEELQEKKMEIREYQKRELSKTI